MKALIIFGTALFIAGCAINPATRTTEEPTVAAQCDKQESVYNGYRLSCIASPKDRACVPANKAKSEALRTKAKNFCATAEDTAANRVTIRSMVDDQLKIGR